MSPRANEEDTKKGTPMAAYLESFGEFLERTHRVGGFPLAVFGSGLVVILLSTWLATRDQTIGELFLWIGFLLALVGIVMHLSEKSWKRGMIQRAFDRFDGMIKMLFSKYLESKGSISELDLQFLIRLLSRITGGDVQRVDASLESLTTSATGTNCGSGSGSH